jgi:signal peptidase II
VAVSSSEESTAIAEPPRSSWRAITPLRLGLITAIIALVLDQANKLWLLFGYDIAAHQPVHLTPFLDIVLAKNPGISYSLFRAHGAVERWTLFAIAIAATALLTFWLWRTRTKLAALGLGLIIGGALGNACDRFAYGYVADFYHFHVATFSWYAFNLADVAICVGVAVLLIEALVLSTDGEPT